MPTGISWTNETWNPTVGCTHVSPGCDGCYAARLASGRLKHVPEYAGLARDGRFTGEVRVLPDRLGLPLRWRKPRRVFVDSMSDLFHRDVPDAHIARVFATMALAGDHVFQVLTKRHARMKALLNDPEFPRLVATEGAFRLARGQAGAGPVVEEWPLPNVWLGVSVEDQHWANLRVPALVHTPAAVRFLSCEPLLGPIDLMPTYPGTVHGPDWLADIDWVIVGGESGPGARPMDPAWARDLRDQCVVAGVAFHMKQLGAAAAQRQGAPGSGHRLQDLPPDLRVRQYPDERSTT